MQLVTRVLRLVGTPRLTVDSKTHTHYYCMHISVCTVVCSESFDVLASLGEVQLENWRLLEKEKQLEDLLPPSSSPLTPPPHKHYSLIPSPPPPHKPYSLIPSPPPSTNTTPSSPHSLIPSPPPSTNTTPSSPHPLLPQTLLPHPLTPSSHKPYSLIPSPPPPTNPTPSSPHPLLPNKPKKQLLDSQWTVRHTATTVCTSLCVLLSADHLSRGRRVRLYIYRGQWNTWELLDSQWTVRHTATTVCTSLCVLLSADHLSRGRRVRLYIYRGQWNTWELLDSQWTVRHTATTVCTSLCVLLSADHLSRGRRVPYQIYRGQWNTYCCRTPFKFPLLNYENKFNVNASLSCAIQPGGRGGDSKSQRCSPQKVP